MMAHGGDSDILKRKRSPEDVGHLEHSERIPQPPPPQSGKNSPVLLSCFSTFVFTFMKAPAAIVAADTDIETHT